MKNISVFAHYDKDNLIDDYVVYYLNELKNVSHKLVFVSDCDLPESELAKLKDIADFTIAQHHGEYDFGSYKRGWKIALENELLNDAATLTFANDSCYGPFYPLAPVYEEMNARDCDFWGITSNENLLERKAYPCLESSNKHIQSYFFVFKKQVFESDTFVDFVRNIKKENDKFKLIESYEIGMTAFLCKNGFNYSVLYENDIAKYNLDDVLLREPAQPFIFMKNSLLKELFFVFLFAVFLNKVESKKLSHAIVKHIKRIRKLRDFKIKYFRKHLIRLKIKEHKIFLMGKWYIFK